MNKQLIENIKQGELYYYTQGGEFKNIERLCGKDYIIEKLSNPNEENKITKIISNILFFAKIDNFLFSFKLIKKEA